MDMVREAVLIEGSVIDIAMGRVSLQNRSS